MRFFLQEVRGLLRSQLGGKFGRFGVEVLDAAVATEFDGDVAVFDQHRLAHAAEWFAGNNADLERVVVVSCGGLVAIAFGVVVVVVAMFVVVIVIMVMVATAAGSKRNSDAGSGAEAENGAGDLGQFHSRCFLSLALNRFS